MIKSNSRNVKREQKKVLLFREICSFVNNVAEEQPAVRLVYVTKVDLSADTGICYIFFGAYGPIGQQPDVHTVSEDNDETFKKASYKEALEFLKLYKASMRRALAQKLQWRYVPDLVFVYDDKKDKVDRIESILDKVSLELRQMTNQDDSDNET